MYGGCIIYFPKILNHSLSMMDILVSGKVLHKKFCLGCDLLSGLSLTQYVNL